MIVVRQYVRHLSSHIGLLIIYISDQGNTKDQIATHITIQIVVDDMIPDFHPMTRTLHIEQ